MRCLRQLDSAHKNHAALRVHNATQSYRGQRPRSQSLALGLPGRSPPARYLPTMRLLLFTMCLVLAKAVLTHAQPALPLTSPLTWPGTTSYDPAIPTPEEVIGHRIGERHTIPSQVVRYFEAVAKASPRVTVRQHGLTHEGRALVHAIVTTPERQSQLDAIAEAHTNYVEGGDTPSTPTAKLPVAYMGYSIHGDEASGTEAAILTLYHLAAGQGPAVDSVLNGVITLIDPMFNPDGRDRFTDWANRNRGAVATTDPQDREHNQEWPRGRTNHYFFDLNRDWLPLVHPESQARIELFYKWRPQVLTDYHEMGSEATYFFQPGIPSRTNPGTPPRNQELTGLITDYSARALDRIGSLYYTRESFDDYYYGKGSTYPDVNGSIGILFEQASSRALEREVQAGVLDYGFTVRNQLTASLATLQAVAAMGGNLVDYSRSFYAGSSAFAKTRPFAAYRIPMAGQAARAAELAGLLHRHNVQVYREEANGGSYVIPVGQQQARFLTAVMEPNTTFQDSLFYDVSTWTLPLAYDVRVERINRLDAGRLDSPVTDFTPVGKLVGDERSAYAYVFAYQGYYAPRAVYRLLHAGAQARLLNEPVAIRVGAQSVDLPRGSVVVPIGQNPIGADSVRALVQQLVEQDGLEVYAATTGLTPTGPDLGGRSTTLLREPKVGLLMGDGANAYQAGTAWHLLSERMRVPVSLLDVDRIGSIDLSRYTHLAMTGGSYGSLDLDALKKWLQGGGTLVASHTAANWAVTKELVKLEEVKLDVDSLVRDLPYAQLDEARGAQYIGGAIFDVELDATHPLAYGMQDPGDARGRADAKLFRQQTNFYKPSETPGATVGRYAAQPLASGYLSTPRARQAAGTAAVVSHNYGRGKVVLFFDQPVFRGFFRGSERLWLNALMLEW